MLFLSHVKDVAASLKKYLFKENNMNRTNNIFWQGLAEFAKSILACVNVTYTGAEGSMHIDIVSINKNDVTAPGIIEQRCPTEFLSDEIKEAE